MAPKNILTRGKKLRALDLFQERRFGEAAALYEQICRTDPRDAQAWCALSTLHGLLENPDRSAACAERAIALAPDYADAHNNLSAAYALLERAPEAEASARRALKADPQRPDSWVNLGNALCAMKRSTEAREAYASALKLRPGDAEAHVGMGEACTQEGDFHEALAYYQQAFSINPHLPAGYYALGNTLTSMGREEDAIAAYRRTLALKPDYAAAWNRLGVRLVARGDIGEGIDCLEKAQRYDPRNPTYGATIGHALTLQCRHDEAIDRLREAAARAPGLAYPRALLLFSLLSVPDTDPAMVFAEHIKWGTQCVKRDAAWPTPRVPTPKQRLRIGYVSADLRRHSVAFFIEPLLLAHDRSKFEIFCYSNQTIADEVTERLRGLDVHWRDIRILSDERAVQVIREDEIDILVDLGGHTGDNRLTVFACKPAPVQVTYLGYPNTTGLAEIDYRITDAISDPPDQDRFYTERLVRLPNGFLCYRPPEHAPAIDPAPHSRTGHVTFGSFNASHKINKRVIALWSRVLQAVPGSTLFLKNKALSDAPTRNNLLAEFEKRTISAERIQFGAWANETTDHLALYNQVDIALDTFPYNGTTTTCEALWMGVPVIALVGDRHVARVGASLLTHAGLPELLAEDEDNYVRLARDLAQPERLLGVRATLRERIAHSPLCDTARFTRVLEEAYLRMWADACSRLDRAAEPAS